MRLSAEIIAQARAAQPQSWAGRTIELRPAGKDQFAGLCPFHQERTPSFRAYGGKDPHFHCYGCGAHGSPIDFVMKVEKLAFREAVERLVGGSVGVASDRATVPAKENRLSEDTGEDLVERRRRIGRALAWWRAGVSVKPCDPVERYLRGRGLELPPRAGSMLRYRHDQPHDLVPGRRPAMLARVDDARGEIAGVHVTYLHVQEDGRVIQDPALKAGGIAKMTRGVLRGGAIRLFGTDAAMGLAEGIEDALSAHAQTGLVTWACMDAGKLAAVELPFEVGEVVIFADRDKPTLRHPQGIGVAMAMRARERFLAEMRKVVVLVPRIGKDFNDQLRASAA